LPEEGFLKKGLLHLISSILFVPPKAGFQFRVAELQFLFQQQHFLD
jgi:hypothetical protein